MSVGVLAPRKQVNTHDDADTDSSVAAIHHTIGATALKAAAGNHGHSATGFAYLFGQGVDGDFTLDGAATPGWASRAGSIYSLSRDVNARNLTINAGVELRHNGFRIYVSGTLTNRGSITANGLNAAGQAFGTAPAVNATRTVSGNGSNGATGVANGAGGNGGGVGAAPVMGGAGGAGGISGGGSNGGAGGTLTPYTGGNANAGPNSGLLVLITGGMPLAGAAPVSCQGGGGGASGGCTSPGVTGAAGAGGGGGGVLIVAANVLDNAGGTISANGGNGSAGQILGGTTGSGGGGGGGGGTVLVSYGTLTALGTIVAAAGNGGAGVGTGAAGVAGSAGTTIAANLGPVV